MTFSKILLIDDDTDDQEIFLTAVGEISDSVSCSVYSDASEALKKLISKEIAPDVIFLDLNMPVMTGQQFLVEIKKIRELQHIPVIILSTTAHQPTIQLTKILGAFDFITKPEKFADMVDVLKPFILNKNQLS